MLDGISHKVVYKVARYQNIYLYQKILTYLDLIFIEIHIDPEEECFLSIKSVKISTRKAKGIYFFILGNLYFFFIFTLDLHENISHLNV